MSTGIDRFLIASDSVSWILYESSAETDLTGFFFTLVLRGRWLCFPLTGRAFAACTLSHGRGDGRFLAGCASGIASHFAILRPALGSQ